MSKERARRRAERLALAEEERAARARAAARRARRRALGRALRRRLVPSLPSRRTGRIYRRSRGERAVIAALTLVAILAVWFLVDALALRLALIALLLIALPAIVVIALGRRT